jgi:transposase
VITSGEAIAGMILNGLGFATRPLSLTPQFCASTPLELLFREGIAAEMFNRCKRGRTLDEAHAYGCDLLCPELALALWAQESIARRVHHLDTTSVSLSGEYVPERDEQALTITRGDSRDHRPDLKPAVLERMGSQDGGVPFVSKRWEGNTSDSEIFQARAQALMTAFKNAPSPRYLIADAKLYHADNAPNLRALGFITRIPNTIGPVSQVITQARTWDTWHPLDETTRYQRLERCPYGMAQRWLVVHAQAALARAETTVNKARQREDETSARPLVHLQAQRFPTPEAAQDALGTFATGWKYHQVDASRLPAHKRDTGKGRPTPKTPLKAIEWQIDAHVRPEDETLRSQQQGKACFVLGTHICASQLSDTEVIAADKGPARVDGGFRFLKDPRLFVSSLFVKKPSRVQGLLMVMTFALLVYSVAQHRLRQQLVQHNQTGPNPINPPTTSPTLRGVFPLLEGIHRVRVRGQGQVHALIEGLNDVQIKVRRLFGERVCYLYQISPG